ncbi:MAG: membrane protein insertase YidC [Phycisphaerales bacterium]|nr:membrane protein insertase YidC [Phycisphaerales bacterium]
MSKPKTASFLVLLLASVLGCVLPSVPAAAQDEPAAVVDQSQPETVNETTEEQSAPAAPAVVPYRVRAVSDPGDLTPLGDLDDESTMTFIEFTPLGAGIEALKLPNEYVTTDKLEHVRLQQRVNINSTNAVPFAALAIEINGSTVGLANANTWRQLSPGVFEAFVEDLDGNPVARIERRFAVPNPTSYSFTLTQTVENLTDAPISTRLISTGPIDLAQAKSTYAGDRRRVRYGYLQSPAMQQGDMTVVVDDELKNRSSLLGKRSASKTYAVAGPVWPTEKTREKERRLSWIGFSDRYFTVIVHPQFDPATITTPEQKLLEGIDSIDRLVLNPAEKPNETVMVLRLNGATDTIAPGVQVSHTLGVFAGQRTKPIFNADPLLQSLNVPAMVVYNLGGMCAPCTFGWLTGILINVLRLFHSISGDWAISIIMLVVLVRTCLHPVTRWSQIRMQKFGVQMQSMAPKQKALKEKYKDDPKKLQAEMGKLWREEGLSPTGMLGCLPMFLQSPVFIALYATLFFAVELRHQPAFYGIFQKVTGGSWHFLYDLSMPDGAIPLPFQFSFPLWGTVNSINILPLLLGVVFFAHQKYLTPPTQATLTPEQASQQKMMKVMMVVMFPLMMYTAPSGLALYFITNSTIAIFENKWIRAHMNKHGMLDIENIRAQKKEKGPGFLARMAEAAEMQKQLKEKGPRSPNPADRRHGRPR